MLGSGRDCLLLEESCSVAIDAMGEGEKQIPLFNLQHFVLESWIHKFFEIHLGIFQLHFWRN